MTQYKHSTRGYRYCSSGREEGDKGEMFYLYNFTDIFIISLILLNRINATRRTNTVLIYVNPPLLRLSCLIVFQLIKTR